MEKQSRALRIVGFDVTGLSARPENGCHSESVSQEIIGTRKVVALEPRPFVDESSRARSFRCKPWPGIVERIRFQGRRQRMRFRSHSL